MGKSERQTAEGMAKDNNKRVIDQGDQTRQQLMGALPQATADATRQSGKIEGAYTGMGGPTGGYDPGEYADRSQANKGNAVTGGFDPAQLEKTRNTLDTQTQTGGYDPEQMKYMQGGYKNLSETGGISDVTADAMRRRAATGVASTYATLGANLARKNTAQGFGGGGGETAQMARQGGQAQAEAITSTEAEIGKTRQAGTIAGLGGLSNLESSAAAGRRGAAATGSELEQAKARGTLSADQAQQDLATNAATQRIAAAGGLQKLYESSPGYVTTLVNQIMQQQSVTGTLTTEQAQIMQELSKQPGLFGNIMNAVGTVGGAAAGVMGGYGAVTGKKGN